MCDMMCVTHQSQDIQTGRDMEMRMQWKSKKDTLYFRFYGLNGDFSMKRENFDRVPKGEGISPDHRNQSSMFFCQWICWPYSPSPNLVRGKEEVDWKKFIRRVDLQPSPNLGTIRRDIPSDGALPDYFWPPVPMFVLHSAKRDNVTWENMGHPSRIL